MTLVTARPSYSLEWSDGAAGPLLADCDEERGPSWQDAAACQYTDPEAFFPEKGGSTREAKAVCRSCDVRAQCLEYALENGLRHGIWGGLSERERRRVKPLVGQSAGAVIAEADERDRRSLERSNLRNVARLAAERRRREEAALAKGIAA